MRKIFLVAVSLSLGLLTCSGMTVQEPMDTEPAVMLYLHSWDVQKYPEVMTEQEQLPFRM